MKNALSQTLSSLQKSLSSTSFPLECKEYGTAAQIQEGVVLGTGLPNLSFHEVVRFPKGEYGMAFLLEEEEIGIVLLDKAHGIDAGQDFVRTQELLSFPVGEATLGRVLDPLGRPLDGKKSLQSLPKRPIEQPAPSIMDRLPVDKPLYTGILSIDAMVPIGRGQRELIIGDRQTGKTAVAIDTLLRQKDQEVLCIYCFIGKEGSEIQRVVHDLKERQALDYSLIIAATGKDTPGLQYIAPFSAMTLAEFFMEKGKDVLVVFDDLTRHAWAYRELSLLLRRPPSREAYPGDIFFLHSHLLERATRLKEGGSITALPIAETEEQNIAAYIPTNLISITDGQIYLSPKLYQEGILPAVDEGKSVSRVGGKAQSPLYRESIQDLRLTYTQFEELEDFARFGTKLDPETEKKLERGKRIREVLKQPRLSPLTAAEQIVLLLALNAGEFDKFSLQRVGAAKKEAIDAAHAFHSVLMDKMESGEHLTGEEKNRLLESLHERLKQL